MTELDDTFIQGPGTKVVAVVVGLAIASAQWLLGREIRRRDTDIKALQDKRDEHELRIRAMEIDRVGRGDLNTLYKRLDAMTQRAEDRHIEILDRLK